MMQPSFKFSSTVRSPKRSRACETCTTPRRNVACGGCPWIGLPSSSIRPSVGCTNPLIVLRIVDLPLPLAPSRETISPSPTCRLTPRNTMLLP